MLKKYTQVFKNLETPFYFYDMDVLEKSLLHLKKAADKHHYQIHYAVKANANLPVLELVKKYNLGIDCVSGNEVQLALDSGFASDKIVFAGVGKSDKEILLALKSKIHSLNVESVEELKVIAELAESQKIVAPIALRINPNVDAKTHRYITTGLEENKFGINIWDLENVLDVLKRSKFLQIIGLHFHIGSQVTDLKIFKSLCLKVNELQNKLAKKGISLPHLNLGGGFGVNYLEPDKEAIPDFYDFFQVFKQFLKPLQGQIIHFELGRSIIAQAGSLISRVLYVKKGVKKHFVIIDAGMTELLRPALYQSYHKIENLSASSALTTYDVVGPICESSDIFGKSLELPKTKRGDLIAIRSTGAYGEVMSMQYNLRTPASVYYSDRLKNSIT